MLIGEISKVTGFSKDTIRWYEKIGLITLKRDKTASNNYRRYDSSLLERLLLIKTIKSFGFTLGETQKLLTLDDDQKINCNSITELFQTKMRLLDQQINDLQTIKGKLVRIKEECTGNCKESIHAVEAS